MDSSSKVGFLSLIILLLICIVFNVTHQLPWFVPVSFSLGLHFGGKFIKRVRIVGDPRSEISAGTSSVTASFVPSSRILGVEALQAGI